MKPPLAVGGLACRGKQERDEPPAARCCLEAGWATDTCVPHVLVAALAPATAERGSGSIVTTGS